MWARGCFGGCGLLAELVSYFESCVISPLRASGCKSAANVSDFLGIDLAAVDIERERFQIFLLLRRIFAIVAFVHS